MVTVRRISALVVASIARMRARMGIIYLPGAYREKNGRRKTTCVYAHYVAISIVQHVPKGMENECFQAAAPFVPVDVRARVGNARFVRDNKDESACAVKII